MLASGLKEVVIEIMEKVNRLTEEKGLCFFVKEFLSSLKKTCHFNKNDTFFLLNPFIFYFIVSLKSQIAVMVVCNDANLI